MGSYADEAGEDSCSVVEACWAWEYPTSGPYFDFPLIGVECNSSSSFSTPVANISDGWDGFWVCPAVAASVELMCTTPRDTSGSRSPSVPHPEPEPRGCSFELELGVDCDHDGAPASTVTLCADDYGVGDLGPDDLCPPGTATLPLLTDADFGTQEIDCDDTDASLPGLPLPSPYCADSDGDGIAGSFFDGAEMCPPDDVEAYPCWNDEPLDCDDDDPNQGVAEMLCPDDDGDGYGTTDCISTCETGEGWTTNDLDCNDSDAALHPWTYWMGDPDGDGHFTLVGMGCPIGDTLIGWCDESPVSCDVDDLSCSLATLTSVDTPVCPYDVDDLVLLEL